MSSSHYNPLHNWKGSRRNARKRGQNIMACYGTILYPTTIPKADRLPRWLGFTRLSASAKVSILVIVIY
eukprot:scaffold10030_cov285-Amphora_coffeaeformis.AAC.2